MNLTFLPFGLTGGPSAFQRTMDQVLRGLEYSTNNVIDDIFIFSEDFSSHRAYLHEVFRRLSFSNMTLRGKKCLIGKKMVICFQNQECLRTLLRLKVL